ncbi:uncharacterized protein LOC131148177 [Malania oleifera]|uniref:uncharacterized protein LOC131148177 n=1 Tax=Malania oleifera TaxID=397392 RepID=UPI0025AEC653|nr:uncharacterized protein LOC131148177 [Malania oleifera]
MMDLEKLDIELVENGPQIGLVESTVALQVMVEIARSSREQGSPSVGHECMIEKFTKMNPLKLSRRVDPAATMNWMKEIEKVLVVLQCTEEQRVLFPTYKLTREAERWWTFFKLLEQRRTTPIAMTWDQFKELFSDKYFLATVREAKVEEFWNLKQGQQSI